MCSPNRQLVIIAAICSMLEAAVSVVFGVVALLLHSCTIVPTPPGNQDPNPLSQFIFGLFYQYFYSQGKCLERNPAPTWAKNLTSFGYGMLTKPNQVEGWFIGYIAENSLWLTLAVVLVIGIRTKTKWIYRVYTLTLGVVMAYDTALIVVFGLDIQIYIGYIYEKGIITKEVMLINIIVMMLIFSRLVIFFILNIFFVCGVQASMNNVAPPKRQTNNNEPIRDDEAVRKSAVFKPKSVTKIFQSRHSFSSYHQDEPVQKQDTNHLDGPPDSVRNFYPTSAVSTSDNKQDPRDYIRYSLTQLEREPRNLKTESNRYSTEILPNSSSVKSFYGERKVTAYPLTDIPSNDYPSSDYPPADYDSTLGSTSFSSFKRPTNQSFEIVNYGEEPSYRRGIGPVEWKPSTSSNVDVILPHRLLDHTSSSFSDEVPEIKNQRPWSYIRPEDFTLAANKLNQFNNQSNNSNKSGSIPQKRRPQYSVEDNMENTLSTHPNSKYPTVSIAKQPIATNKRRGLSLREESQKDEIRIYENVTNGFYEKGKDSQFDRSPHQHKNVKFNGHSDSSHSLNALATSSPSDDSRGNSMKPTKFISIYSGEKDGSKSKLAKNALGSGEQICTDEFIVKFSPQLKPKEPSYTNRPKRKRSSTSSPNLVFDPISQTVRIVYENHNRNYRPLCRKEGSILIHHSSCNGKTCLTNIPNETAL